MTQGARFVIVIRLLGGRVITSLTPEARRFGAQSVRGSDVLLAADACEERLSVAASGDWSRSVPGLEWTVTQTVAHAANGPLWYALDIWSGEGDEAAFDVSVEADASNAALIVSLRNAARVCAASLDAAAPTVRGFHPDGSPDPSGFAAMACDELLVHTYDAAQGLGLPFSADPTLAGRVLARLFPWHEIGNDPWATLLWANGRIDLPGRPDQRGWQWHPAPLTEWTGRAPTLH
jgi:uncharacterized protein (TIGR03083 family)